MLTFNPGPSQLSPKIRRAICEIAASGFLSLSHRSQAFMEVSKQAIEGLREKMGLPTDYHIFYQPSATVAMDTLLRNLVVKSSFHFVHGSFSELFFQTATGIGLEACACKSALDLAVPWENASIPQQVELIAVTHNETSTGLMWPQTCLQRLRQQNPDPLIAIDVTSSFGAMRMPWLVADLWLGSVQKCLGLPSGLGFLIVSPRAVAKAAEIQHKKGAMAMGIAPWQRFDQLAEKMRLYQTPETPNMLNIALLAAQMADWDVDKHAAQMELKAQLLYAAALPWKAFIADTAWRSPTVVNMAVDDPLVWQQKALLSHMILGKGHGKLKESCLRIANFPSISLEHIQALLACLQSY